MNLVRVEHSNETHLKVLYELLAERRPDQSISHKSLPAWDDHCHFVFCMAPPAPGALDGNLFPLKASAGAYKAWYLIQGVTKAGDVVGAVYLTDRDEIGVHLFSQFCGIGAGSEAVKELMRRCGDRKYLANINPANEASIHMFEKLGFKHVQNTYALEQE